MIVIQSNKFINPYPKRCVIDVVVEPSFRWRVLGDDGVYWPAFSLSPIELNIGDRAYVIGRENTSLLINNST